MTSLEVTDTDAFLDMGQGAQLLYFHLNSRADDDGFVANPKKILRAIGGNEDDLKLLILKKFLIAFEDGVCVIKHWRINNFVRKDLYKETKYLDHRQALFIRANGTYTLSDDGRGMKLPPKHYTLDHVDETLTKRQLRVGKDSIEIPAKAGLKIVEEPEDSAPTKKTSSANKEYDALISWLQHLTGVRVVNKVKQYTHLSKAKAAGISPTRLKNRASELFEKDWYQENGLDWGGVVSSFDKRA